MKYIIANLLGLLLGFNAYAQQAATSFDVDGVKVIFKPTAKTMVCARMYFKGGVQNYPESRAGIERLTLNALTECGTKAYTADRFKDSADRYNIHLAGGEGYDYGAVELTCILKYFDRGWDLFADAIKEPVFEESQVGLLKNRILASIRAGDTQPSAYADELAIKNAFEGTVYSTNPDGNESSVNQLSVADLKDYYFNKLFNKNRMFIVVVGNISIDDLTQKVKALVAGIPSAPYQEVELKTPLMNDNKNVFVQRDIPTDYIVGVVNAPKLTSPDYLPFKLGLRIFGGLLFSQLRTNNDLSYDQGAHAVDRLMPYGFVYVSTTEPKQAIEIIIKEMRRMKDIYLTEGNMNRLRNGFITNNYMELQNAQAIAYNLGNDEVMGGWYYFENTPATLDTVTPEQIVNALQKYLSGVRWAFLGNLDHAKTAADAFKMPVK